MMNKTTHSFKGMRKDVDSLKFSPEYLEDARNIRLTPTIKDTLLSITCERYPDPIAYLNLLDIVNLSKGYAIYDVKNIFSTSCNLNDILVLFMSNNISFAAREILIEESLIVEISKYLDLIINATENNEDFRNNAKTLYSKILNIYDNLSKLAENDKETPANKQTFNLFFEGYQGIFGYISFIEEKLIDNNNGDLEWSKNYISSELINYKIGDVRVTGAKPLKNHIIKSDTATTTLKELIIDFIEIREIPIIQTYNYNSIIVININTNLYNVLFSGYRNLDTGKEVNYLNLGENIDFLPYYENKENQKIYWVDGINQPRVINIATKEEDRKNWDSNSFDFIPTIASSDTISVDKTFQHGNFAPGVIQYCFTYFDKDGKESNIVNISPLLYIKDEGKGNSPEDIVTNNSFNIKLENTNPKFENARIYSIHRTSLDSIPTCKVVGEIPLKSSEEPNIQSIGIGDNITLKFKNYSGKEQKIKIERTSKSFDTNEALNDFKINGKKAVAYKDLNGTIIISLISQGTILTTGASEASEVTLFAYGADSVLPEQLKPFQPGQDDNVIEGGGGSTPIPSVKLTSWSFPSNIELKVGDSRDLRVNIEPSGATGVNYSFIVENNEEKNESGILDPNTAKIKYTKYYSSINVKALKQSGEKSVLIKATVSQPSYNLSETKECTISIKALESNDFNLNTNTGIRNIEFQETLRELGIELILPNEEEGMYFNNTLSTEARLSKGNYEIHNTILDTGLMGYNIDPSELLYKGGDELHPSTITQKDGTLFLGNVTLAETQTTSFLEAKKLIQDNIKNNPGIWTSKDIASDTSADNLGLFTTLSEETSNSKAFKRNETYRFGIQLQDNQGKWTPVIPLLDTKCTGKVEFSKEINVNHLYRPKYLIELSDDIKDALKQLGYYKIRPLVVLPTELNREIIAQGIVNSTVYNTNQRCNTEFAAQSSWFFRPIQGNYGRFGTCTDQRALKVTTRSSSITVDNIYKDEDVKEDSNGAIITSFNNSYWPLYFGDKQQASAGFPIAYRHHELIPSSYCRNAEFPHIWYFTAYSPKSIDSEIVHQVDLKYVNGVRNYYTTNSNSKLSYWDKDYYAVDCSILTFHSPEIEFNKISNVDGCKFRLVGYSLYSHAVKGIDVQQEGAYFNINEDIVNTRNIVQGAAYSLKPSYSTHTTVKFPVTLKTKANDEEKYPNEDKWPVTFATYTWNYPNMYDDEKYKLKVNKSSHLHIFDTTKYFDEPHLLEIADTKIFDGSIDNIVLKFPEKANWQKVEWTNTPKNTFVYKGNVNDVIASFKTDTIRLGFTPFNFVTDTNTGIEYSSTLKSESEYPMMGTINNANIKYKNGFYIIRKTKDLSDKPGWSIEKTPGSDTGAELYKTSQPIQLTYKSSPHGVIVLDCITRPDESNTRWLNLPRMDGYQEYSTSRKWNSTSPRYTIDGMADAIWQDNLENYLPKNHRGYLYIGELYRDMTPEEKYGSLDNENNIWTVAGKSVSIDEKAIQYTEGDTFLSQYDCLKTYPRNNTDFNQVTEIGTFWIETRVNTATRYDNNRNQVSNMHVSPNNFNKFNPVYDQTDNFFTYRTIKDDLVENTKFPHTIVWSKQKIKGDKIDTWTNINMTATLDLDGIDGNLVKLYNFNNEIFSFQPKGINHILFNSRVQINSSDGVPIEIQNGYRVDGARKISSIGASHIKCINDNNSSVFFTDSLTKGIYAFNGSVVESLSDKLNFSVWASKNITNDSHVYVDHTNKNIYIRNKVKGLLKDSQEVLGYSELLGEFESFYDYNSPIFKTNTSTYTLSIDDIIKEGVSNKSIILYKLYSNTNRSNDLNFTDSYVSIIHNNSSIDNKCYSHIEFKADPIEKQDNFYLPFKGIKVDTQDGSSDIGAAYTKLIYDKYRPSNLKKKFNSWRIEIPRKGFRRLERFQNPWAKITLYLDRSESKETNKIGNELGHSIPYLDVYFLE